MWLSQLDPAQVDAVRALSDRARTADAVDPLNEEARFALRGTDARHLIFPRDGRLLGYLQWHPGHGTGQLVVDPDHRRREIGRALVGQLADHVDPVRLWSFRDLPAARAFAAALGLVEVRALLVMTRDLTRPVAAPALPDGVRLRPFDPARDAEALLDLNARSFADHPEQGGLTMAGLRERLAEEWFDPDGLLLAEDDAGLAGFHWTKRHDQHSGEVYVIAVAPRARGRGIGAALLRAGLAHLAARGCHRAVLYVDSAESGAIQMYERAGFEIAHRDVVHASVPKEQP